MEIEKYQGSNKQWYWRIRAANGRTVADSGEGYKTEQSIDRAIDSLHALGATLATMPVRDLGDTTSWPRRGARQRATGRREELGAMLLILGSAARSWGA